MQKLLVATLLAIGLVAGCLDSNGAPDSDNDGLSDRKEAQYLTNPNNPDTDLDGLKDGDEVDMGTNATAADSDGDGTYDGVEVAQDTDPLDPLVGGYVIPEVPAVDAAALLAMHEVFVTENPNRRDNTADHENARVALMGHYESFGLEVYRHNFNDNIDQANIVGIKWGVVRDEWVVVGGHYDIVNVPPCPPSMENGCPTETQGAYDDGSGTMMTVELARAFSTVDPYYTMAFVAYDGEERGLNGAQAFVRDFMVEPFNEDGTPKTPYGQIDIHGDVDLDMIGLNWPGVTAPVNVIHNSVTAYDVANEKRIAMGWPDEAWMEKDGLTLGSSDYAAFWSVTEDEGGPIPTIFFISDFEELGVPDPTGGSLPGTVHTPAGAYPFWHLEDTVTTMRAMAGTQENLEAGFQASTEVAAAVLHAMACQPNIEFQAVVR